MENCYDSLRFALKAGEIMLSSGAETYRIEDTIERILRNCGYADNEVMAISSGVFASVNDENNQQVSTLVKRIKNRSYNFEKVILVNEVSRNFGEKKVNLKDSMERLNAIDNLPSQPKMLRMLIAGVSALAFAYVFGAGPLDCINAFLTSLIVSFVMAVLAKSKVSSVLSNVIGGSLIAFFTIAFMTLGLGDNESGIIIGSLMPLLPGVTFTNAIRDILEGDFLSGTARTVDAITVAVALASGVGAVLKIWLIIGGSIGNG